MDIVRRSPPTKLDTAPKGSKCIVSIFPEMKSGNLVGETECVTYIQTSSDEEDPTWEICEQ